MKPPFEPERCGQMIAVAEQRSRTMQVRSWDHPDALEVEGWISLGEAASAILGGMMLARVVKERAGRSAGERPAPAVGGWEETAAGRPETGPLRKRGPAEIEMEEALTIRRRSRDTSGARQSEAAQCGGKAGTDRVRSRDCGAREPS